MYMKYLKEYVFFYLLMLCLFLFGVVIVVVVVFIGLGVVFCMVGLVLFGCIKI